MSDVQENLNTVMKEVTYSFRKQEVVAPDGTKTEFKRDPFKVQLPMQTKAGLMAALASNDAKVIDYICDCVNSDIATVAKGLFNEKLDNMTVVDAVSHQLSAADVDVSKLTLVVIANMPKGERGGISKEDMAEFVKEYITIMSSEAAKPLLGSVTFDDQKKATHQRVIESKFALIRARDDLLKQMRGYFDVFVQAAEGNLSEVGTKVFESLSSKLDSFMGAAQIDAL